MLLIFVTWTVAIIAKASRGKSFAAYFVKRNSDSDVRRLRSITEHSAVYSFASFEYVRHRSNTQKKWPIQICICREKHRHASCHALVLYAEDAICCKRDFIDRVYRKFLETALSIRKTLYKVKASIPSRSISKRVSRPCYFEKILF